MVEKFFRYNLCGTPRSPNGTHKVHLRTELYYLLYLYQIWIWIHGYHIRISYTFRLLRSRSERHFLELWQTFLRIVWNVPIYGLFGSCTFFRKLKKLWENRVTWKVTQNIDWHNHKWLQRSTLYVYTFEMQFLKASST